MILFKLLAVYDLRKNFPNRKLIVYQIISNFFIIWVYYMTSKTIQIRNDLDWYGFDYFHFLITGEIALLIPQTAIESHSIVARLVLHTKSISDLLRQDWKSALIKLNVMAFSITNARWPYVFMMVVAAVIFQSQISFLNFVYSIFYCVLSLPVFLILSLGIGSIVLATGRGEGIVNQIIFIFHILAGAYFPVEIMGKWAKSMTNIIPPTFYLDGIRKILSGHSSLQLWVDLLQYQLVFSLVFAPISIYSFMIARRKLLKDPPPVLVI